MKFIIIENAIQFNHMSKKVNEHACYILNKPSPY